MKTCTYDNPKTMMRECWLDELMLCRYSAELFAQKRWPPPPEHFFFGANIGDWKTGQLVGDVEAMPARCRPSGSIKPVSERKLVELVFHFASEEMTQVLDYLDTRFGTGQYSIRKAGPRFDGADFPRQQMMLVSGNDETLPNNERIVHIEKNDQGVTYFLTERDGGLLNVYEGPPPEGWPQDLRPDEPTESNCDHDWEDIGNGQQQCTYPECQALRGQPAGV